MLNKSAGLKFWVTHLRRRLEKQQLTQLTDVVLAGVAR